MITMRVAQRWMGERDVRSRYTARNIGRLIRIIRVIRGFLTGALGSKFVVQSLHQVT
jgi:hypothetical protein